MPAAAHTIVLPRRPLGMSATGVGISVALHVVVVAVLYTSAHRAIVEQREAEQRRKELEAPPPPPFSFVPARLLKLGNMDPEEKTEMPQREVPALPTAPPEPEVETTLAPNPDAAVAGPRPVRRRDPLDIDPRRVAQRPRRAAPDENVNAVWDRLRQDFPERGGRSRVRGWADGDPDGTELDRSLVRPGDWYATQLMQFFQERWSVPNMISQRELARLWCKVRISIDAGFRIVEFEMTRSSGNARYDASVEEVLRKLQQERSPLPAVPSQVRDHIIANGMILKWMPGTV